VIVLTNPYIKLDMEKENAEIDREYIKLLHLMPNYEEARLKAKIANTLFELEKKRRLGPHRPDKYAKLFPKNAVLSEREKDRMFEKYYNLNLELIKIMYHVYPELVSKLCEIQDLRNPSYIKHSAKSLLVYRILMGLMSCKSMREGDALLNNDSAQNLLELICSENIESMPHYDTVNNFLEKCSTEALQGIIEYMAGQLVKNKVIDKFRINGEFIQIAMDGVRVNQKGYHTDMSLFAVHNKGEEDEYCTYYCYYMECKLIFGNFSISLMTEFVENKDYAFDDEASKQDCERKASIRLLDRLKAKYPKTPFLVAADSLMNFEGFYNKCIGYGYEFITRFKGGSIPSIAKTIKALEDSGEADVFTFNADEHGSDKSLIEYFYSYANELKYKGVSLNYARMSARKFKDNHYGKRTNYLFLTTLTINRNNAVGMVEVGRKRWSIENQGFNEQKRHELHLCHTFSRNDNARKCHYLLIQIAHAIRQFFEMGWGQLQLLKEYSKSTIRLILREHFRTRTISKEDFESAITAKFHVKLKSPHSIYHAWPKKPLHLGKVNISGKASAISA
jgi:hypothetical protein